MSALVRWFATLSLFASSTAWAADLPGPWVELASDGGLDVRSIVAPGMDCPKVVADGTALTSTIRGKADGDYPVPSHTWLLTHRPIWALTQGPGATLNATQQAAIRDLVPEGLDMVLSGHIHDFSSYAFGPSRLAQLVVGEGGDANDAITQPINPGIDIDGLRIRRALAIPDYGYVVLHRVSQGWAGTVHAITDQVLARCRLHGRDVTCRSAAR
jgi:hypothetical protein